MTFRLFQDVFNEILRHTPLPCGHYWKLEKLKNADFRNNPGWIEILNRTSAKYQCNDGHAWGSSWTMMIFRFDLNSTTGRGTVRMKRFGQRCSICKGNDEYYVGFCDDIEVWRLIQFLLLYIMQRCYERRIHDDTDAEYYIIPTGDVSNRKHGGSPHRKEFCEACIHNRCQEMYRKLTKKK